MANALLTREEHLERLEKQHSARVEKASRREDFFFVRDEDEQGPFIHCLSFVSGNEYKLRGDFCPCDDFRYRASPSGTRCKHLIGLEIAEAHDEVH